MFTVTSDQFNASLLNKQIIIIYIKKLFYNHKKEKKKIFYGY